MFVPSSDPIGAGLVASLAHPGGNVTGVLLYEEGIAGKWLTMLKRVSVVLSLREGNGTDNGYKAAPRAAGHAVIGFLGRAWSYPRPMNERMPFGRIVAS